MIFFKVSAKYIYMTLVLTDIYNDFYVILTDRKGYLLAFYWLILLYIDWYGLTVGTSLGTRYYTNIPNMFKTCQKYVSHKKS